MEDKPIINSHAHIFTSGHVPPYIAKTFVPWPLYYLLPVGGIVAIFRWWNNGPNRWQFQPWYKAWARRLYLAKEFLARNIILNLVYNLLGFFLTLQVFFILYDWLSSLIAPDSEKTGTYIGQAAQWLTDRDLLYLDIEVIGKIGLIVLLCFFFASGRNLLLFIFRNLWKFLGSLPGKATLELAKRYLNLGRYAFHNQQALTFQQLESQYPLGTKFVILPMDMQYMEAGNVPIPYRQQMQDLAALKQAKGELIQPFVFADPRRFLAEPDHFVYETGPGGRIVLKDCFIKSYIEDYGFAGFKIYPALGYYPFDETLLPLWKYAADHGLPVLTHCIRGTIFFRGSKKKEWDTHPIFQQAKGEQEYVPLLLPQIKNIEFINNFTHPLNFLCLLDKDLLRQVVAKASPRVREVFGYNAGTGEMAYDLSNLKICFGHFGGDDEWDRFFEADRNPYTAQLYTRPDRGIDFTHHDDGTPSPGKPEQIWKNVDWYTIICSLMLQHPNVYADISYIVHNPVILPLLTRTLQPESGRLRERVLYGTDFYVVRNYKSDKNMLSDMLAGLTEEEFDLIARENPERFLRKS
ncbi:MAG TPA: hypothetical protein VNU72_05600 [Puia sp.]|nr:hypothetical protein [Puia sp.]